MKVKVLPSPFTVKILVFVIESAVIVPPVQLKVPEFVKVLSPSITFKEPLSKLNSVSIVVPSFILNIPVFVIEVISLVIFALFQLNVPVFSIESAIIVPVLLKVNIPSAPLIREPKAVVVPICKVPPFTLNIP